MGPVGGGRRAPVVGARLAARRGGRRRLRIPEPPALSASARPVRFDGRGLLLASVLPPGLVLDGGAVAPACALARGRALGRAARGAGGAPLPHQPAACTRSTVARVADLRRAVPG